MDNFDAIKRMDKAKLEAFLDQVYLTGLNTGMYAAALPNDSEDQALLFDENPFSDEWLSGEAEQATLGTIAEDGDEYILDALATPRAVCGITFTWLKETTGSSYAAIW